MNVPMRDPVAVAENLGMDVIDVATNFVGILAMSQVIASTRFFERAVATGAELTPV
jgi:hypothetical protein